jgi:putative transposase
MQTKDSLPTIRQNNAHELYSYISGITKQKNSHVYRINGIENHIHILTDMNPSIAPIDFVMDIKVSSSRINMSIIKEFRLRMSIENFSWTTV